MKVKVYAKLNLTLNVGERKGAFHPIDSVATSVDICDVVEVVRRNDVQINVQGIQQVEVEQNTAYKAAEAFRRVFAGRASQTVSGVDISIRKGIPFGGGLGGSSADAAAVVYCMCKLFGVDICSDEVRDLCSSIGSDVNFMLFGGLGRLQGKGDKVTRNIMLKPLYFAMTTFDNAMSSASVYSAFDSVANAKPLADNSAVLDMLESGNNAQAIPLFSNHLQQATASIDGYADSYLALVSSRQLACNMTGSGSAYYVACVTQEDAEEVSRLLNAHGFSTTVCKSMPLGIVEL